MAKRFGSPSELTPSYAQWQALVKVCASALCHMTLAIRIDQILRLAGYDLSFLAKSQEGMAGHPEDLAQIISLIGDVASGRLLNVSIIGGPACSWIAVFAESVLGLRVLIKTDDEHVLSANFDTGVAEAQVVIEFDSQIPRSGITCVGRVYILRPGDDFIRHFFRALGTIESPSATLNPSLGGRIGRDNMLKDTFGNVTRNILTGGLPKGLSKVMNHDLPFVKFFVAGAMFYVHCTSECARYANLHEFIHSALVNIPELDPLKAPLLKAAESIRINSMDLNTICRDFQIARNDLSAHCGCAVHSKTDQLYKAIDTFCSVTIAETVLVLSYFLGSVRMVVPMQLRRIGILSVYEDIKTRQGLYKDSRNRFARDQQPQGDFEIINSCLMPKQGTGRSSQLFSSYMSLFSGDLTPSVLGANSVSAVSDGRLFCFVDTVRELSDRFERASVIHIGPGSIQAGSRLHYKIYDGQNVQDMNRNCYQTSRVGPLVVNVETSLQQDTTSPELKVTAVVEDNIRLLFWYQLSSRRGDIIISPASYVDDYLAYALGYKKCTSTNNPFSLRNLQTHVTGLSDIFAQDSNDVVAAYGEGLIPNAWRVSASKAILRGHCNNMLGRCAAIATSQQPMALLDQDEDLETFAQVLYAESLLPGKRSTWTVI